jgi:hypothetical protein
MRLNGVFLTAGFIIGCNTQDPSTPSGALYRSTSGIVGAPMETDAVAVAVRYGFPLSDPATTKAPSPTSRVVTGGSESFVLFPGTGAVQGWSSNNAPQAVATRPSSLEEHDRAATQYFASKVGLVMSEVGGVIHFAGYRGGAGVSGPRSPDQLIGFSTSLVRRVSGFDVVDSIASVELNARGTPVNLSVHWPAPDAQVLSSAAQLKRIVDGGWLPPTDKRVGPIKSVRVVLHHSLADSSELHWSTTIRVDYDVQRGTYQEFDANGNLVNPYKFGPVPASSK